MRGELEQVKLGFLPFRVTQLIPSPHPSPSRGEGEEYLTPHLNPLPKERKKKILIIHTARSFTQLNFAFSSPPHPSPQPYGTQFHSTQLRFVGSASVLKERENAVGSASVLREEEVFLNFRHTERSEVSLSIPAIDSSSEIVGYIQNFPYNIICLN